MDEIKFDMYGVLCVEQSCSCCYVVGPDDKTIFI